MVTVDLGVPQTLSLIPELLLFHGPLPCPHPKRGHKPGTAESAHLPKPWPSLSLEFPPQCRNYLDCQPASMTQRSD